MTLFRRKESPVEGLRVRKLADRDADRLEDGSWPLFGLAFEGDPPRRTRVSMSFVARGEAEGWLELANKRVVHRPGGPPGDVWRVTHTFVHADTITFKTVDGPVQYRVRHLPDKYVDGPDPGEKVTDEAYDAGETRVDWFYELAI